MKNIICLGVVAIVSLSSAAQSETVGDGGRMAQLLQTAPVVAAPLATDTKASPAPAAKVKPLRKADHPAAKAPHAVKALHAAKIDDSAKTDHVPDAGPAAKADAALKGHRAALPGVSGGHSAYQALIVRHASANGVPAALGDAVVRIESGYSASVVHAGNFGLMQIRAQTARGVGYSGTPSGLLDPDTNLHFGMKYLSMAYRRAGGDTCRALMLYQSGIGARSPNAANRAYCSKAQRIMASR